MNRWWMMASWAAAAMAAPHALAFQSAPTYTRDVAPILAAHCVSCHRPGGDAPISFSDFEDVRPRARSIVRAISRGDMPPWKPVAGFGGPFAGARGLAASEIETIVRWADAGAHRGDGDPAAAPGLPSEWPLGTPDLVVTPGDAYMLASNGPDVFRTFAIPVPIDGTKFVAAVDVRPGVRAVHHANIRLDDTPRSRELDAGDAAPGYEGAVSPSARYPDGYVLGWTPGQSPLTSVPGMAWRLRAGTDLVLQLHLRPTGSPLRVQPRVALYFTHDAPVQTPMALRLGRQNIDIGPGARFTTEDRFELPVDVELLAIHPHAHYRAREIRATADLPDGTERWLLRIDDWDFNWQDVYRYSAPVPLPKGTTIRTTIAYDNSAANPRNPDRPPRRVVFGQASSDEMGDVWLQVVTRTAADRATLYEHVRPKMLLEDAAGAEMLAASNPGHAGYRHDLASINAALGRLDLAIEHYLAAARLKPDWATAHYNAATLLATRGRLEEAVASFERSIALRPDHAESHNNLGAVLETMGRTDQAIEHLRRAVALDPTNVQARANLAKLESRKKR